MYRYESQLYAVALIAGGLLIWKAIDEIANFFNKDERAAAREHELKMAELKLKLTAQGANLESLNPVAQDAMDELKKLREARARERAQTQPKVDIKTDKVRPFPTKIDSVAAAQAFERGTGTTVFASVV
jgi:uncharacterized protein YqgV (UPF0045/DUF77 family)